MNPKDYTVEVVFGYVNPCTGAASVYGITWQ